MLAGGAVTGLWALVTGEPASFDPAAISTESLIAVVYLIFIGSMLAYTSYAWLLRNAPLPLISTYAYVNPVVAVALGTVFLGEQISLRTVVASAVILAAVAIIVTTRGRLAPATLAAADAEPADAEPAADHPSPSRGAISPASPPRAPSG
jgi:drug/metabolite transporter (DMT)-like permease